jgi:hypothetical protein
MVRLGLRRNIDGWSRQIQAPWSPRENFKICASAAAATLAILQEFQRDEAVETDIFGFVDDAHAAAEAFHDAIVREGLIEQRIVAGHVLHKSGAERGKSTQTRQSRARVEARRRAGLPVTRRRSMPGEPTRLQQPRLETPQTLSCKRWSIRSCWRRIVLFDPNSSRIPWQLCRWPPPWNRYQLVSCGLADHSCGAGIPISLRTWIPP